MVATLLLLIADLLLLLALMLMPMLLLLQAVEEQWLQQVRFHQLFPQLPELRLRLLGCCLEAVEEAAAEAVAATAGAASATSELAAAAEASHSLRKRFLAWLWVLSCLPMQCQ